MNFTAFQQSAFLQSLGWAIANSIWQGGMLWIFYQILVTSYQNASAKFKNNLSTALLFGNFLWFVVTFFTRIVRLRNYLPGGTANRSLYYTDGSLVAGNIRIGNFISSAVITLPYLSLAYLLLLLIFAIKLVNSYRNTNYIKSNGLIKPGAEWRVFVDKVANHIDLRKKIIIWFSEYVDVPATIGFLKPVILVPLASLNQLTPDQVEAIILHEISHIKRNDYLINLFISLIETILFFNPFVVLLGNIIKKERENCCDDFVLQYQYDRHSYASALLVLERSREQQFRLALAATSGRKQLLFRIKRIMEVKNSNDGLNYGQKLLALLLSTAIICSVAWLTPEKKGNLPSGKPWPAKASVSTQPGTVRKTTPLAHKEPQKIISFIKPQTLKEGGDDVNLSDTSASADSSEVDSPTDNQAPANEGEIAVKDQDDKAFVWKNPAPLNELSNTYSKFFSPNSFSSYLNLIEGMHFGIDVNKLKDDIEKGNKVISSTDWQDIKHQIQESFEKSKLPKFKMNMNIQKDKIDFTSLEKQFKKIDQRQFQMLNHVNVMRNRRIRPGQGDSLHFSIDHDGARFYYDKSREDNLTELQDPPPAEKENKYIAIAAPPLYNLPAGQYEYSYQTRTSPKVKLPPPPSICIGYKEGSIIINGEKINLSDIKRSQAEKIVRKLVKQDNNRQTIEIELHD